MLCKLKLIGDDADDADDKPQIFFKYDDDEDDDDNLTV